jgi:cytochrome c oxidase subunit 3
VASDTHAHAAHGPRFQHHHFDDMVQQRESNSLGMWLFLATEVMMFGGLFLAYTLYRWQYPSAFHAGSMHLNIDLGTFNTFVLLASSFTMAMAVHSAATGQKQKLIMWLVWTWIFGAAFLGIKAVEWTTDWKEGLVPGFNWTYYTHHHPEKVAELTAQGTTPNQVLMYFVVYFSMTGLHAIHMIVGLGLVGWFIVLAARNQFEGGNDQPVEIAGLYWHIIDIIWIFLFPLLYLIAGFHPGRPMG